MKELSIISRLRPTGLHSSIPPLRILTARPPARNRLHARPKATLASKTGPAGHNPPPRKRSRLLPKLLVAGALASSLTYYLLPPARPTTLNPTSFVPYTVTSKTALSPTSFIISLRPQHPCAPGQLPYLTPSGSWWDFQWSVQVKQPELQIQREYTPLPPTPPPSAEATWSDDDNGGGELRFFVRRVEGGEVSRYLDARREGDTVEVRLGPRGFAFNYLDSLEENRVVCLAGGTGIATAMQIAHAVLHRPPGSSKPSPDTSVQILWAVRQRSDVQTSSPASPSSPSLFGGRTPKLESLDGVDHPTAVTQQLLAMKSLYGPALDVRIAVDDEGTSFGEPELKDALLLPARATSSRRGAPVRYPVDPPPAIAAACAQSAPAVPERIPPVDVPGSLRRPVFVCGPEGFVDRYAGRAVEVMGAEGGAFRTGGLLGRLNARYGDGEAWLVLGFP